MQVLHIFEVMNTKTRLKKLNVRGNSLRSVDLLEYKMSSKQRLPYFNILHFSLRSVPPGILSSSLVTMEDVNLWSTSLAKLQVMSLFDLLASGPSSLSRLNIGENSLVAVQATNLAKSLRKV